MCHFTGDTSFFTRLVNYELRCAKRHRRFVSLVVVSNGKSFSEYQELLTGLVRECDAILEVKGGAAVLMTETGAAGAATVVERFKGRMADFQNMRFAAVSFPNDGQSCDALIHKGRERLQSSEFGM